MAILIHYINSLLELPNSINQIKMLTASLFTLASAMGAMAMPTAYPIYRRAMDGNSGVDDTTVLQYALTLEHLENKF